MILIVAVVSAAALFLYWSWHSGPGGDPVRDTGPSAAASGPAPPFTLPDLHGNRYSSSRLAGKPAAINFFSIWCPPCREEIPGFIEVYNRHRESGFELIGINLDRDAREELDGFLAANRVEYPVLVGDMATLRAYGGAGSFRIPTTFFIGRDGTIRNVIVGYIDRETFDREVRKLF